MNTNSLALAVALSDEELLTRMIAYLELHHVLAYAKRGGATAANIAIRCRRHNQYEAELVFGPRTASPSTSDS